MSKSLSQLLKAASAWLLNDPDPETVEELRRMIQDQDVEALQIAFGGRLQFGTAGLRGRIGPGPSQMNRVLVRQVAAGMGNYVVGLGLPRRALIGFDGRKNSRVFAEDSACVLASLGFEVFLYDEVVATPVLSHGVVALGVQVGVMVTASHNPPEDNGYKVYWSNGAQIIPPHDAGISSCIEQVDEVLVGDIQGHRAAGRIREVPLELLERYYAEVADLRVQPCTGAKIAYSAMHGVGGRFVKEVLQRAGHTAFSVVEEQWEPDGRFPTVRFPNPEEPGAMDLLLTLAGQVEADVALANDPDADRLAVAVRSSDGIYQMLSGNEIGLILAETLLSNGRFSGPTMVATTIVSSTMLQKIGKRHGALYAETLTGFKWIANRAIAHGAAGGDFVIGFEEALGYSVGPVVRDKDGVSAILIVADLASSLKARGLTLLDELESIYRRYGLHLAEQVALKLPGESGLRQIAAMMEDLRLHPPQAVGGRSVVSTVDLQRGVRVASGREEPVDFPPSNVLGFYLEDGSRILARPSGTEPKIKFYFEVVRAVGEDESVDDARNSAQMVLGGLKADFLELVGQ